MRQQKDPELQTASGKRIKCSKCEEIVRGDHRGRKKRLKAFRSLVLASSFCDRCYLLEYEDDPERVSPQTSRTDKNRQRK